MACHALAAYLQYQAKMLRRLRDKPEEIADYEASRGKDAMTRLLREKDPQALDREAEAVFERVVAEFADVRYRDKRSLGDIASGELFAIRNLAVGKVAPEIEGEDYEGRAFTLGAERGKVVVLTFSGNWCGPCKALYPQERGLVERHKGKPFAMLSVNTDEDRETLAKSIASGEITWRCWADGGTEGPITTRWGISSFPSVFVLDPRGVIRHRNVRGEELDKAVERAAGRGPRPPVSAPSDHDPSPRAAAASRRASDSVHVSSCLRSRPIRASSTRLHASKNATLAASRGRSIGGRWASTASRNAPPMSAPT